MADTWNFDPSRYEGHERGPWSYHQDTAEGMEWNIEIVRRLEPHMRIAFMANFGDDSEERSNPTARLIADAPHLLAEVQRLTAERDRLREALKKFRVLEAQEAPDA